MSRHHAKRLLPTPERALGEAWIPVPLRLYEVVSTRPGAGLTVRDVVADGPPVVVLQRLGLVADVLDAQVSVPVLGGGLPVGEVRPHAPTLSGIGA